MNLKTLTGSGVLALALPIAATAATVGSNAGEFVQDPGTNTFTGTFVDGKISDIGDLNIASNDVSFNGGVSQTSPVNAGVTFDVFSDPLAAGAQGAVQLLLSISGSSFAVDSASFDGQPLTFNSVATGQQASFSTNFDSTSDLATFLLEFSGAEAPDNVQVSIAPVSPVPLPAGIFLLGAGLGGFGLLRKLKKA